MQVIIAFYVHCIGHIHPGPTDYRHIADNLIIEVHFLQYVLILKLFFEARKKAWTNNSKWCNYTVCTAEGGLLFNN